MAASSTTARSRPLIGMEPGQGLLHRPRQAPQARPASPSSAWPKLEDLSAGRQKSHYLRHDSDWVHGRPDPEHRCRPARRWRRASTGERTAPRAAAAPLHFPHRSADPALLLDAVARATTVQKTTWTPPGGQPVDLAVLLPPGVMSYNVAAHAQGHEHLAGGVQRAASGPYQFKPGAHPGVPLLRATSPRAFANTMPVLARPSASCSRLSRARRPGGPGHLS